MAKKVIEQHLMCINITARVISHREHHDPAADQDWLKRCHPWSIIVVTTTACSVLDKSSRGLDKCSRGDQDKI